MTESERDFLAFVGYDEEAIAAAEEELDASSPQIGVWRVRETNREPAVTLFERTR